MEDLLLIVRVEESLLDPFALSERDRAKTGREL
jgi:hypothetical protein